MVCRCSAGSQCGSRWRSCSTTGGRSATSGAPASGWPSRRSPSPSAGPAEFPVTTLNTSLRPDDSPSTPGYQRDAPNPGVGLVIQTTPKVPARLPGIHPPLRSPRSPLSTNHSPLRLCRAAVALGVRYRCRLGSSRDRSGPSFCGLARELVYAAAAGLIDASSMDITTMRARVEQARVGRLASAARRPSSCRAVLPCRATRCSTRRSTPNRNRPLHGDGSTTFALFPGP